MTKQIELDFTDNLPYKNYKVFTIVDKDIKVNNKVDASLAYDKTFRKDIDEFEMDDIIVIGGFAHNGSFKLVVKGLSGNLYGRFKVNYSFI